METTLVLYDPYYAELVENAPILRQGYTYLPEGPGLGIRLRPEVVTRADATCQRSEL
jgi:L-alanine-DL-glutamate epimerase-like enolase superfamily enzyme